MRVVQALGWYFPESTGGTETYVRGLAAGLQARGVEVQIASPCEGAAAEAYRWEGVPVHRYPLPRPLSKGVVRGTEPPPGLEHFQAWLEGLGAQIYHQHALTSGCGIHHLRAARRAGLTTVLTLHVPGPVCLRGTMLLDGTEACDGQILEERCARCWMEARGATPVLARAAASLPEALSRILLPAGRLGSALGSRALVRDHRDRLRSLAEEADGVVAVCQWLQEALRLNGIPASRVVLNRQGVDPGFLVPADPGTPRSPARLVVGFLGRWDPVKGLPLLARAIHGLDPHVDIELQAHVTNPQEPQAEAVLRDVESLARHDPRLRILPPLDTRSVATFIRSIDVLAVPSQWLETGPLVVLEAFACGTPVLGSRLGGIQELVQDGVNGLLVPHGDLGAWQAALLTLREPDRLATLRRGIGPVRTMDAVAEESLDLYRELLATLRQG